MRTLVVVPALVAVACTSGTRSAPVDDLADAALTGSASGSGSGSDDGCSEAARLIYVVDASNKLAQFDPVQKAFTVLGTLSCPTFFGQPFSMAIDRSAHAFVVYSDNKLYEVDTTQSMLPCTATTWSTQHGLEEFGMGYSTDAAGGTADTLFIAGGADLDVDNPPATSTLATLDTTSLTATAVGTVTGWPELTGNANAELWGWFPDKTAPRVEQIDKTSGAPIVTYPLPTLAGVPNDWAFGFYGGDYWVFLQREGESNTSVYEIAGPTNASHTPGSIVSTTPAAGLSIVGAGVSTCAPTVIQ